MMSSYVCANAVSHQSDRPVIIRLVRMTFIPTATDDFLSLFDAAAPHIREFSGCLHLELWQDTRFPNVFTTYSHWDSERGLADYRSSELFEKTWALTKPLFAAAPLALTQSVVRPSPMVG